MPFIIFCSGQTVPHGWTSTSYLFFLSLCYNSISYFFLKKNPPAFLPHTAHFPLLSPAPIVEHLADIKTRKCKIASSQRHCKPSTAHRSYPRCWPATIALLPTAVAEAAQTLVEMDAVGQETEPGGWLKLSRRDMGFRAVMWGLCFFIVRTLGTGSSRDGHRQL